MSDTKKQSDSERALARLLAEALRPAEGAASDSACPDAELLAAYAERNLDAAETAEWEKHFAGCARCQKILAVLTVSSEEPLSEAELESFGRKVAAAEVGAPAPEPRAIESKKVVLFAHSRTTSRWLAPAVGIAAAAALWIALRPAPPRGTPTATAQKTVTQPASSGESLEARADVPAPPEAASREAEVRPAEQQQLKSLAQAQPQKKESEEAANVGSPQSAAQADSAAAAPQPAAGLQGPAVPAPATNSPQAKASDELSAAAPPSAPPAPAPAVAGAAADAAAAQTTARAAESKVAEGKAAENRPLQAFAARGIGGGAAGDLAGRPPVVVASPNRTVLWRVGLGGRIERSLDEGRTWLEQSSGVTSDLLAGAAPSDRVAWIAGRAGVILRTTDGERWRRVASPDASADWTSIEASDALHATVTSSDRRRFATEDGGQTWKQQ
jgi:hypothetical protein